MQPQEVADETPQTQIHVSREEVVDITSATVAETPSTIPDTPSENASTQPTTPSSMVNAAAKAQQTPTQQKSSRSTAPIMPIIPAMPVSPVAVRKSHRDSVTSTKSKSESDTAVKSEQEDAQSVQVIDNAAAAAAPPAPPKSWADLVRKQSALNGVVASATTTTPIINGLSAPKSETLGDVLGEINTAEAPTKVVFLQPRGLVNTGNMCYMNSVSSPLVLLFHC